ncbi:MFS transporter [Desulfoferula mesophila]|uniref:MFS transporter n=1 Tax=Desulfoferula mesophila TaxID=3058419 RepID=A0AAU9EHU7_9BACT|nr:MFS transporter [Desulfoferula mesophilus]
MATKDAPSSTSDQQLAQGLRMVTWQGLALQAMLTLTGGTFLVALALRLGADNLQIGILAAIPPLTQLAQIPWVYLVQKTRRRKALTILGAAVARACLFVLALAPVLLAPTLALYVIMAMLLIKNLGSSLSNSAWNSWMRDLVPSDNLGSFYSKRHAYATLTAMVLSLGAAVFLDWWKGAEPAHPEYGYSIIFLLGIGAGVLAIYFIGRIPEVPMPRRKIGLIALLLEPFKDANFRNLIYFLGSWNFAVNLAAPFFTVYMLKRLGYSMTYVIALGALSQLVSVFFYLIWGKLSDRYSNKSVLAISGPLFIFCLLGWTFVTFPGEHEHALTMPLLILLHVAMGISASGTNLSTGNIAIKLAPRGRATGFLAATTLVNSLAASLAPLVGGRFADFFKDRKLSLSFTWEAPGSEQVFHVLKFQHWDFFFMFAFLLGGYSLYRLGRVRELGDEKGKITLSEAMAQVSQQLRNFSTAGGLRGLTEFPVALVGRVSLRRPGRARPAKGPKTKPVGPPSGD